MSKTSKIVSLFVLVNLSVLGWGSKNSHSEDSLNIQDHIDIRHVYARYNNTIDDGDAKGWVSVWTKNGNFNGFKGHDALLLFANHYIDNQDGALRRHWINNLEIKATPSGASAYNYFMILDVSINPPKVFSTGKNHDTFVKANGIWKFDSRTSWSADGTRITIQGIPTAD